MFRQGKNSGVCDGSSAFCHNRSSLSVANFTCCKCAERTAPEYPSLSPFWRAHAPRALTPARLGLSPNSPAKVGTRAQNAEAPGISEGPIAVPKPCCVTGYGSISVRKSRQQIHRA
jgi:hypothetical protein